MNKQEFIRDLKLQAKEDATLQCLVILIEQKLEKHSPNIEINTDKNLSDVYSEMRKYAQNKKNGNTGCCPPDKAVDIAIEVFGINLQAAAKKEVEIDILSLI